MNKLSAAMVLLVLCCLRMAPAAPPAPATQPATRPQGDPMHAVIDKDTERKLAAELFGYTWSLLDKKDRTPADDMEMIHAAHASRFHWGRVGTAQEWSVGEWQIARVYATLGRAEPAQFHARQALKLAEDGKLPAFYVACAHEVMARAALAAGDRQAFQQQWDEADRLGKALTNREERDILYADLNELKTAAAKK